MTKQDKIQPAMKMRSEGFKWPVISARLDVHQRTIQRWISAAKHENNLRESSYV